MQTRFSVNLFFIALVCGCGPAAGQTRNTVALPSGGVLRYSAAGGGLELLAAPSRKLTLERDDTVAAGAAPDNLRVVGEVRKSAVVLVDTYPSKPGGLSYCQAGEERFLRVISLEGKLRETLRVKLASCRQNIELASPGIEWNAETSTLSIHWLLGPSGNEKSETRVYKIAGSGSAELLPARN
jgi:hypothetical protein